MASNEADMRPVMMLASGGASRGIDNNILVCAIATAGELNAGRAQPAAIMWRILAFVAAAIALSLGNLMRLNV